MRYRYRVGWFGKIILQVGIIYDETELDQSALITVPTGRKAVYWRDATFQDITEHQATLINSKE